MTGKTRISLQSSRRTAGTSIILCPSIALSTLQHEGIDTGPAVMLRRDSKNLAPVDTSTQCRREGMTTARLK